MSGSGLGAFSHVTIGVTRQALVARPSSNLPIFCARLAKVGVTVIEHGSVAAMFGSGPVISFRSPAAFRIEVRG